MSDHDMSNCIISPTSGYIYLDNILSFAGKMCVCVFVRACTFLKSLIWLKFLA
jgi:hypothetical protein